jgi:hypothetical protein
MLIRESPKAAMVSGSIARPDSLDFDPLMTQDNAMAFVHRSLSMFTTTEPAVKTPESPTITTRTLVKTKASNVFKTDLTINRATLS